MDANSGQREPGSGLDVFLVAAGLAVLAVGIAVWAGAKLAVALAGGAVRGGIDVWLRVAARLAQGRTPAQAWADDATRLPASWLYWACTGVCALAVGLVGGGVVVVWHRTFRDGPR